MRRGSWGAGYAVSWFECGLNRCVKFVKIHRGRYSYHVNFLCILHFNKKFFKNELCVAPSSKELTSNEGGRCMSHSPRCKNRDGSDALGRPRGTDLFWFRGQRITVHWESWDLGGEENRRDEWRTIQAELWGQRPETQYQAWLIWEVSEALRSWSMEVGAGPQEAAQAAPSLSYFIPDSHTACIVR